jgi:hypothetical protein
MPRPIKSLTAEEIFEIAQTVSGGEKPSVIAEKFDIAKATVGTIKRNFGASTLARIKAETHTWNKYRKIFRAVFEAQAQVHGATSGEIPFTSKDITFWQNELSLQGGNAYDLKYNAKGRGSLPPEVQATAPDGFEWRIVATAKGEYLFKLYTAGEGVFDLDPSPITVKVPDALPAIVERYARSDEQALLARIRYNNLVSVFLGMATYSLQSHWKTSKGGSPVEVDEMYVGLDRNGAHYSIPVEAKGRAISEKLTAEQILSNYDAAADSFPETTIVSVAAKVVDDYTFALIRFDVDREAEVVTKVFERHYTIASNPPPKNSSRPILTAEDVRANNALSVDPTAEVDASSSEQS